MLTFRISSKNALRVREGKQVTDKVTAGKGRATKGEAKVFYKPYRVKPVEVYAEPGPGGCTREKTD